MQSVSSEKYTYYQYAKEQALPIFVKLRAAEFDPEIGAFMQLMNFTELNEKESEQAEVTLASKRNARILTINEASPMVGNQIRSNFSTDKYGQETAIKKNGYYVYRFKNMSMIVLSKTATEWLMGTFPDFGHAEKQMESQIILNRYLAWSLSQMGISGFWGSYSKNGMLLARYTESRGEAFFIDYRNSKIFTMNGVSDLKSSDFFFKVDPHQGVHSKRLKMEDTQALLAVYSCYFGADGVPMANRQVYATLSKSINSYSFSKHPSTTEDATRSA